MRILVAGMLMASGGAAVSAQADSAAFIIRLGADTTAIERYVRSGNQQIAEVVPRSPATRLHRMVYSSDAQGRMTSTTYTPRRPDVREPANVIEVRCLGGRAVITARQHDAVTTRTQRSAS